MEGVFKKFYDKDVWRTAYQLQKNIFDLTQSFPRQENYGLIDQLNRSTNSVLANMAEADGRYHYSDKVRILYIVRGEIQEVQSHLIVATSRNYLEKKISVELINQYESVKKSVNCFISSLLRNKKVIV